jgi:hypothetical protein
MTAKIKLNAASGGGSISINAPSSAGSDTDLLDTSGNLSLTGNCKVGTITDTSGNNSSTTAQIAQGRAKKWIVFNGYDTGNILDSFDISSITDNGTGDYTINFATAFSSVNYVFSGAVNNRDNSGNEASGRIRGPSGIHQEYQSFGTTTAFRVEVRYGANSSSNGGVMDVTRIYCAFFGD